MDLTPYFTRAANKIASHIARARGFEISKDAQGQPMINLLDHGKRHKVMKSGKVNVQPNIMARLGLRDIVDATKNIATPKIQMMVRMMCLQAEPQHTPIPVRVNDTQKIKRRHEI